MLVVAAVAGGSVPVQVVRHVCKARAAHGEQLATRGVFEYLLEEVLAASRLRDNNDDLAGIDLPARREAGNAVAVEISFPRYATSSTRVVGSLKRGSHSGSAISRSRLAGASISIGIYSAPLGCNGRGGLPRPARGACHPSS